MATRLYIQNAAAAFTPTNFRGAWDSNGSAVTKKLDTSKSGAAATNGVAETSSDTAWDVCLARFVTPGLTQQKTIEGTIQWIIGQTEGSSSADMFWHAHIYVTAGDTDTVRGTLLTDSIGATEWTVSAQGSGEGAKTLTSVDALVGDRIVVEIGYRATNSSTSSFTGTVNYGNTGATDLTSGNTSVTTRPGWIEFSQDTLLGNLATTFAPLSLATD